SMFLYNSGVDAGLPSDHFGVAYPDTQAVRAVCPPPLDGNLLTLLSHEFNHLITHNTLGQPGTSFMNEGIATATIVERFHNQGRHFLSPWTASRAGQLPSVATLVDDGKWSQSPVVDAYNTSASFIAWLIDSHGPAPLKAVFTAQSNEIEGRVRAAYNATLS